VVDGTTFPRNRMVIIGIPNYYPLPLHEGAARFYCVQPKFVFAFSDSTSALYELNYLQDKIYDKGRTRTYKVVISTGIKYYYQFPKRKAVLRLPFRHLIKISKELKQKKSIILPILRTGYSPRVPSPRSPSLVALGLLLSTYDGSTHLLA
jgi:hypothetical protein